MKHPILGTIEFESGKTKEGIARVEYHSRTIEIQIMAEDEPFDLSVELAASLFAQLEQIDQVSKAIIGTELREVYNGGWNEYDEMQEDGSTVSVSNPQLSESEFLAKFTLMAINVSGEQVIDLVYDDEGLFWGHSVIVTSLQGVDFREAHAELIG